MKLCGICNTLALLTSALFCKAALAAGPVGVPGAAPPTRTVTEFAKITPSDGYSVAFGASVAVSGDDLVVGAPGYVTEDGVVGTAYVFHRVGPKWIEIGKLIPNFEQIDGEDFGLSVAIEGDFIVVGAPHIIGGVIGGGYGRAFIFRRDDHGTPDDPSDDEWWEDAELRTPDEIRFGDTFGRSVAINNGMVLVGRPGWEYSSGSAYLYRKVNDVWRHVASLYPSDSTLDDAFGQAVAIAGDMALVGAHRRNVDGVHSGAAYVFREVAGVWLEKSRLTASDAAGFDFFGGSVSLRDDAAVIGAQGQDEAGPGSGAAYTYKLRDDGGDEAKLVASDGIDLDSFGQAVATDGNSTVVGAPGKDGHLGSGYLFRYEAGEWIEQRRLIASNPVSTGILGVSVAVDAAYAVVGADEAAYIFVVPDEATSLHDFAVFQTCFRDEERGLDTECAKIDLVPDGRVDLGDFNELLATLAGP